MQKAQRIIKTYRRNRMIVCTICALVTLASTLSVRFISQRNLNQQRVVQFANHAVEELDKVLLPLQAGSEVLLPLIGLPCSVTHLPLRKQAAKLQTVRSIGLVQDGTLYCSSIFGYRNVPVVDILAELPAPQPLLRLTTDRALIKGSPVLIQWTPAAGSSNAGVMEMINIDLLTAMLLEPQLPQISSASLTVDSRHLLYGNGLVDSLPQPENNENYQVSSQRFPFTINVNGPGATALAWHYLPTQLPLAVLLSLLVGYIAWLATAYRMSFSREINLGLAQHEFELFCQPLLNARSQQCIGVEILLRWNNPRQGWMNIGAAVAPDAALASIISTILVIAGHQSIGAGIALAIPLAAAGQVLTIIVRTITVAFQHAADKAADNGNLTAISWIHVSSLFLQAMRVAIPAVIVALSVGTSEVQNMLNAIPEVVTNGLNIAGGMIVVVGYAMVINMMRAGYLMPFFYLGFVTAAFTNFNLVALGVIGTVMAVLYIQLSPKYNRVAGAPAQAAGNNDLDNELD